MAKIHRLRYMTDAAGRHGGYCDCGWKTSGWANMRLVALMWMASNCGEVLGA